MNRVTLIILSILSTLEFEYRCGWRRVCEESQEGLRGSAKGRKVIGGIGSFVLREPEAPDVVLLGREMKK